MEHSWIEVRVARKWVEAEGIVSLDLVSAGEDSLPGFSAGSHIDVELPNGMVRQYSLCNDNSEQHRYQIGVLLDPVTRGGSASVHRDITQGQIIRISEPRNHFPLVPAKRSILIAGGIGVTPILCMAERLAQTDAGFEMHYCTRSPSRTGFAQRIRSSIFADRVHFHFDDGEPAQKLDIQTVLAAPDAATHLYVCGPNGFMDHVVGAARTMGWADTNVHVEYFAGAVIDHSGDGGFEVKLAHSGRVVRVAPDQTVVEALAAHGIEVPVSCEQGVCGTCILRVLEGIPEHHDMYFSDAERAANDQFTPCCSRSQSAMLVVDF